jgi:hypothetical protein
MAAYLERIAAADFCELDAILAESDRDSAITDRQAEHLRQAAIERGTRLLFGHA